MIFACSDQIKFFPEIFLKGCLSAMGRLLHWLETCPAPFQDVIEPCPRSHCGGRGGEMCNPSLSEGQLCQLTPDCSLDDGLQQRPIRSLAGSGHCCRTSDCELRGRLGRECTRQRYGRYARLHPGVRDWAVEQGSQLSLIRETESEACSGDPEPTKAKECRGSGAAQTLSST